MSLPKPTHLEIRINEWLAAQEDTNSVEVVVRWRGAAEDPTLAGLLAELPPANRFVPIILKDGKTELAFAAWKGIRFGKGPSIFEAARLDYEAWAGGPADGLAQARKRLMDMIRPYVPDFDDYSDREQVDFIIRTQEKVNAARASVKALISHLEYAAPDKHKALPPLRNPLRNVQAAVFCDVVGSLRAGDLLGIPLAPSDEGKYQNQTVLKMAKLGHKLLYDYFGEAEWKTKVERMCGYHKWWEQYSSLDDPKVQVYALLAKARGTSPEHERLFAEKDGFDGKLDEWITVVESRLKIEEIQDQNKYSDDFAWPGADEGRRRSLQDEQFRIQESDERFAQAFSVFDAPPDDKP